MESEPLPSFPKTPLNEVKRAPARGAYDQATIYAIVDAAWIGHVGIATAGGEVTVIPMFHGRMGDSLIFHGARTSRLMQHLASGEQICVSFAMVDGLVLAKSLFHHSMNYRSAVVFGRGHSIESEEERELAMRAITDKVMPGRWEEARAPAGKELTATLFVRLEIESASAKVRTGPPLDDSEDLALPIWSGVLPLRSQMDPPHKDEHSTELAVPPYVTAFQERYNAS